MEEYVLSENQRINFPLNSNKTKRMNNTFVTVRDAIFTTSPHHLTESGVHALRLAESLPTAHTTFKKGFTKKPNPTQQFPKLQIQIGTWGEPCLPVHKKYLGFITVLDIGASGLLEKLSKHYGKRVKLKVNVCNIVRADYLYGKFDLKTDQELDIVPIPSSGVFGCEANGITPTQHPVAVDPECTAIRHFYCHWKSASNSFQADVTLTVVIHKDPFASGVDTCIPDNLCINKKILRERIGCDLTLVSEDGVSIKCHKSFVFAHSPVMEAMFNSSMKESETNGVKTDMTEEGIRALLAYLYYWDIEKALIKPIICFELLHAGHKYAITKLEECMKNVFLFQKNSWFGVDVAVQLFLFSRLHPDGKDIQEKALEVLKSKSSILETSETYQELLKKDPKAATELRKLAFST